MWLNGRVYVGGGVTLKTYKSGTNRKSFRDAARLYTYIPEADEWTEHINTPAYYFALTTYNSQLVIASGCEYKRDKVGPHTNKVWTLKAKNDWQNIIPPMKTERHSATGVSSGEYLVIAGGLGIKGIPLNSVEIYNGHQWAPADQLPRACWHMKSVIFKGCLYLMGGVKQGQKVFFIEMEHLIANCTPIVESTSSSEPADSTWKKITSIPLERSSLATFGGCLVAIGGGDLFSPTSKMYAYAPGPAANIQLWIHIGSGDLPTNLIGVSTVSLPSGDLMAFGGEIGLEWSNRVFRASLCKG